MEQVCEGVERQAEKRFTERNRITRLGLDAMKLVGESLTEVIDVCLVREEIKLARFRAAFMSGLVAATYFGEARFAHSGAPKPLHFSNSFEPSPNTAQPVHIVEIPMPKEWQEGKSRWYLEQYSREWLVRHVAKANPESHLLICDVDEIPSRLQLEEICGMPRNSAARSVPMKTSYLYGNWFTDSKRATWTKAKVVRAQDYVPGLRLKPLPKLRSEPGTHFSYLGFDHDAVSKKFQQFAHEEFDRAVLSSARFINFCKASGINHLGHAGPPNFGLLNRLREGDLDRLQLALFAWNPAFFEFSFSREGVLPRLLRAQGVARVVAAAHDNRLVHAKRVLDATIRSPWLGGNILRLVLEVTFGPYFWRKLHNLLKKKRDVE